MTQRDNILQELKELESSLTNLSPSAGTYTVPAGYFDGLAGQVLNRIKALEAMHASEELAIFLPELAAVSKEMPHSLPAGYFENLPENMLAMVQQNKKQSAAEELEELSPLLSSLKKEPVYSVPEGYFDNLPVKPAGKVVSLTSRNWFRMAAAAVVTGVIATTVLLISNNSNPERSFARFEKKIDKEIKTASDNELTEFVELTSSSREVAFHEPKVDARPLLKDVPASELQEFLSEIADPDIADNETSPME